MSINKLKIKNLRCFFEEEGLIRPITILVGENNTGKTTFLSAYKLMHDLLYEPYPIIYSSIEDLLKNDVYKYLGGHKNIIRKQGNPSRMSLSGEIKVNEQDTWNIEYLIENGKTCKKILISSFPDKIEVNIKEDNKMTILVNEEEATTLPDFPINFFEVIFFINDHTKHILKKNESLKTKITNLIEFFRKNEGLKNISCNYIEPIYLEPNNYFDPSEINSKDSSHILCKMAEMKRNNTWTKISEKFKEFGKASKLFQNLDIDLSNEKESDSPFSIIVQVDGLESYMTDAGRGISQLLPILGNIFISDKKYNTFLIQKPETYLHPRVEAEFASLMIRMIKQNYKKCNFICETHGDYIIQRATIEIKNKKLSHKDFLILYFELKDGESKIYPITVNENGKIEGNPDSYKEFFLSEGYRLIGLRD